jgi:hypothetical protein
MIHWCLALKINFSTSKVNKVNSLDRANYSQGKVAFLKDKREKCIVYISGISVSRDWYCQLSSETPRLYVQLLFMSDI